MKALGDSKITIVGAGLMGTSLAQALRGQVRSIRLVDTNPANRDAAAAHADDTSGDFDQGIADADVIVLATPIRVILQLLDRLRAQHPLNPGTLVIDLGSAKRQIVQAMDDLPESLLAIGGHPMCGKETSGPQAADGSLYHGCVFALCRSRRTTDEALAFAIQMVKALDARPVVLDADHHDRAVATISHLPYLLSVGLVDTARRLTDENELPRTLASSGFRETSRLAASNVTMMLDILLTNRDAILDTLAVFRSQLDDVENALRSADEDTLRGILASARQTRLDWNGTRHISRSEP